MLKDDTLDLILRTATEPPLCKAGPVKELLERERELAVVEELLARHSGALAIEVGIGVGKTSLVQAACRRAQELGYEVLSARGSELEADFVFGVVRQLFERRLADARRPERAPSIMRLISHGDIKSGSRAARDGRPLASRRTRCLRLDIRAIPSAGNIRLDGCLGNQAWQEYVRSAPVGNRPDAIGRRCHIHGVAIGRPGALVCQTDSSALWNEVRLTQLKVVM